MSKIINALRDVDNQRNQREDDETLTPETTHSGNSSQLSFDHLGTPSADPATREQNSSFGRFNKREVSIMKNQWVLWFLIIVVIGVVLFAFNYQGNQDAVPLSEIFPSQESSDVAEVEYVFMDTPTLPVEETAPESVTPPETQTVEIAVPDPVTQPVETAGTARAADSTGGPYTIQVASFQKKEYAQKVIDELKQKGHQAFLEDKDLGAKGVWYRVYVGKFQSSDDASQYISRLPNKFNDGFVLKL